MPMPKMNLIGQKFSKLTVVEYAESDAKQQTMFRCICDCGGEIVTAGRGLKANQTKSCGCLRVEKGRIAGLKSKIHGFINSPTYRTWQGMKARCFNESSKAYRWYGAKGVTVSNDWMTFEGFLSDMGERPDGMTLDRINPFGNYEKSNCRWADLETQLSNTRKNYEANLCQQ
jgi:hypothetical protein